MFVQVMIHGGKVGLTKGLYFQKRKHIEKHFLIFLLKTICSDLTHVFKVYYRIQFRFKVIQNMIPKQKLGFLERYTYQYWYGEKS